MIPLLTNRDYTGCPNPAWIPKSCCDVNQVFFFFFACHGYGISSPRSCTSFTHCPGTPFVCSPRGYTLPLFLVQLTFTLASMSSLAIWFMLAAIWIISPSPAPLFPPSTPLFHPSLWSISLTEPDINSLWLSSVRPNTVSRRGPGTEKSKCLTLQSKHTVCRVNCVTLADCVISFMLSFPV